MRRVVFTVLALGLTQAIPNQAQTPVVVPAVMVIDMDGNGICLSGVNDGVSFRFDPSSPAERTAWTCARTADSFLVEDKTKNGRIDGFWEFIGGTVRQNAFGHLSLADGGAVRNGGVRVQDGQFSPDDPLFETLILWADTNHNGISEEPELQSAKYGGIASIDLHPKAVAEADAHGNRIDNRGSVSLKKDGQVVQRQAIAVRLNR